MFCETCFSFLVSERLWESAGSSLKNNIWMLQNVWVFFCLGQSFQKTLSLEFHHKYVLHFSSMTPNKVHQELVRWIFIGWLVFKVTTRASGRCHISRSQRGRRGNCFETRKVNRWTNGSTVCERLAAHYQRCEWRRGRAWKWCALWHLAFFEHEHDITISLLSQWHPFSCWHSLSSKTSNVLFPVASWLCHFLLQWRRCAWFLLSALFRRAQKLQSVAVVPIYELLFLIKHPRAPNVSPGSISWLESRSRRLASEANQAKRLAPRLSHQTHYECLHPALSRSRACRPREGLLVHREQFLCLQLTVSWFVF